MTEIVSAQPKRIYLTFRVSKDELDFDFVSRLLELAPTSVRKKGQFLHSLRTRANESSWSYSTEHLDSLHLKVHFALLFEKLKGKKDVLAELRENGCRTSVSCYWLCSCDNIEAHLSHKIIVQLAEYGLSFMFDIYSGDPGD
ncbi:MAG: hypothetical protein C0469_02810 [Cyanobacteria bacterium DS2.3.42]|nr:hypothetical protein [Cyanobacteria bacterium DS2.3.42]